MQTIQGKVQVGKDRQLMIQLPESIEPGTYEVVVILNPLPKNAPEQFDRAT